PLGADDCGNSSPVSRIPPVRTNVAPVAGGLTDDVSKLLVTRYGYGQWSGARIRAEIEPRIPDRPSISRNVDCAPWHLGVPQQTIARHSVWIAHRHSPSGEESRDEMDRACHHDSVCCRRPSCFTRLSHGPGHLRLGRARPRLQECPGAFEEHVSARLR